MQSRIAAMLMAAFTGMAAMLAPEGMVIKEGNTPYVTLGDDLTEEQTESVLGMLELEEDHLTEDTVEVLTAEEEQVYTDGHPELTEGSIISCSVRARETGEGIGVETVNITGSVPEMYINSLATCGMADADVRFASPEEDPGLSGVLSAMKAYSKMNGYALEPDVVQMATRELILQRNIAAESGDGIAAAVFTGLLKRVVLTNKMEEFSSIRYAATDIARQMKLGIRDEDITEISSLMGEILTLNPDVKAVMLQSDPVYEPARQQHLDLTDYGIDLENDGTFFEKLRTFFAKHMEESVAESM